MKRVTWAIGLAVLLLAGSTLPVAAGGGARGGGGGSMSGGGFHGGGGGWHGGAPGWNGGGHGGTRVFIGGGIGWWGGPGWWGWPGWGGAPYPYFATQPVVIQSAPAEYIQQAPAPPAQSYWYYCQNAGAYYPYVKECPGGWMQVVPQPPSPGQ